jgi:NAD-dependent deacetylase
MLKSFALIRLRGFSYLRPMQRKKVVVLTGAGISAESGISTFRDAGGLWEGHDIMEVASPQGWAKNRELVQSFYNLRRRQLSSVHPNPGHLALAEMEEHFEVHIITQNVDDLHERAGSTRIIHLHGELVKARSTKDALLIYDIGYRDLTDEDRCELGSCLRPHIVWFGEAVPEFEHAAEITRTADVLLVIGTSLAVYPAAGLVGLVRIGTPIYFIDPNIPDFPFGPQVIFIQEPASTGVPNVLSRLCQNQ